MPETSQVQCAVLAKWPERGRVKTRLVGDLSEERVVDLARAMLLDTAVRVTEAGYPWKLFLDFDGGGVPAEARDYPIALQRGEGLGERVANAVLDLWGEDPRPVVVLGTDSPNFPEFHLLNAGYHLGAGAPSVLGPTLDGGVYLLGFRKPEGEREEDLLEILRVLPWETDSICSELMAALDFPWGPPLLLDVWYDVDTPEDLARLERDLKDPASPGRYCEHVSGWVRQGRVDDPPGT